jgi:hypothetical protein
VSNEETHFFAVEIQAITIDNSLPAPIFKVKASPNEWGKAQKAITTGGSGVRTPKQLFYQEFFSKFLIGLKQQQPHFTNAKSVGYDSWFSFASGRSGYAYSIAFRSGNRISCELYIDLNDKELNKAKFDSLDESRGDIEESLGLLSWERLDEKRACRIAIYKDITTDEVMVEWGIKTLVAFKSVFTSYLN